MRSQTQTRSVPVVMQSTQTRSVPVVLRPDYSLIWPYFLHKFFSSTLKIAFTKPHFCYFNINACVRDAGHCGELPQ